MKINNYLLKWFEDGGKQKLFHNIIGAEEIYTTELGLKSVVYEVSVLTLTKEIPMYIDEVGAFEGGLKARLIERSKLWLEDPLYHTGVSELELNYGYKFKVRILAEENDGKKRHELEQSFIEQRRPYTQYNCYRKYGAGYKGFDAMIYGTYRRRAFIVARNGRHTEETLNINDIFDLQYDFNSYRKIKPHKDMVDMVKTNMPNKSDLYFKVKAFVEQKLNINSVRGCNYDYLVSFVAAILQHRYVAKTVI